MATLFDWMDAVREDALAIFEKDPAARNWVEVLTCYPGLHALAAHRVAHELHRVGLPVLPRFISHVNRFLTGIEIHPGARIEKGVVIDHGMGVVIGETAEVGRGCLIYQGVTLGGTSLEPGKRHPSIGRNVVLGSGAKVLGSFNVGDGSFIGSGSVVTKPVPPGATVVGIPGKVAAIEGRRQTPTPDMQAQLPDPVMSLLAAMQDRLSQLEAEVDRLRHENRELRRGS
ncbi:MAG: serine O-acetyltransferase [Candidatus Sericytochromatia bacterium]|nr:serine O-acetyltransferase [Candidatus Sericytochromatia bacterium]